MTFSDSVDDDQRRHQRRSGHRGLGDVHRAAQRAGRRPVLRIGNAVATVTIIDNDDPSPTLSIADASVTEGTGAGTTTISFDVTTSGVQPDDCGYRVVLTHVTTDDADFRRRRRSTRRRPSSTTDSTVTHDFVVTRDLVDEPDETFTVTITGDGATPCAIADGTATGTIIDDDVGRPQDTEAPDVTVTPCPARRRTRRSVHGRVHGGRDRVRRRRRDPHRSARVDGVGDPGRRRHVHGVGGGHDGRGTVTVSVPAGAAQDAAQNVTLRRTRRAWSSSSPRDRWR